MPKNESKFLNRIEQELLNEMARLVRYSPTVPAITLTSEQYSRWERICKKVAEIPDLDNNVRGEKYSGIRVITNAGRKRYSKRNLQKFEFV